MDDDDAVSGLDKRQILAKPNGRLNSVVQVLLPALVP